MAIATNHFTHIDWMGRYLVTVCTLLFMAGKANLGLRQFVHDLICRRVNFMAVVTSNTIRLVLPAVPVRTCIAFVTGNALLTTLGIVGLCKSALLEDNVWWSSPFDSWVTLQVFFTFAVTRLTSGGAGIASHAVFGLVKRQDRSRFTFVMAARTDFVFCQCFFGR